MFIVLILSHIAAVAAGAYAYKRYAAKVAADLATIKAVKL